MSSRWTEFEYQEYLERRQSTRFPPAETRSWEPRGAEGAAPEAESKFMARVVALAKQHGWLAYHTYNSERSEAGFPDLVMTDGQSTLFVELKKDKGKPTTEQQRWLSMLEHAGQEVYLWRPKDFAAIEARLGRKVLLP